MLTEVPINHRVALLDVSGEHAYPIQAEKLTSSSLLSLSGGYVIGCDTGKRLLMLSPSSKDFLNPLTNLGSVSIWKARHCLSKTFSCATPSVWLPHILCQSRNFWISPVGLSI